MNKRKTITEHIAGATDLQDEPSPLLPLVEIAGDRRVLIENHRGVVEYGSETIRVVVKFGQIRVTGCGLELLRMTSGQLIIAGRIDAVQLIRGCR